MLPDRTAGEWSSPPRSEPVESGFAEVRAWMTDIEQNGRTFIRLSDAEVNAMSDPENTHEPRDAYIGTGSQLRGTRSIAYHCRRVRHDANVLAGAVQEATQELEGYLSEQVEERPFTTLGVAAGVGFVLGRGLPSRLTAGLLGIATRLAIAFAAREFSARLSSGASGVVPDEGLSACGSRKERS